MELLTSDAIFFLACLLLALLESSVLVRSYSLLAKERQVTQRTAKTASSAGFKPARQQQQTVKNKE
jgi:hypothetical protein